MKENIILIDWIQTEKWNFQNLINKYTGEKWTCVGVSANGSQSRMIKKLISVYLKLFVFPFKIFLSRKKYNKVLAWQQFLGLILAFYCNVFKVKKYPKLYIMTFIYKPKSGIVGKVYFKFMRYILRSNYIEKVICFSKSEMKYYSELFGVDENKFDFCLYAVDGEEKNTTDLDDLKKNQDKRYLLSVGRSNRDYEFLINSLTNSPYNLVILCDKLAEKSQGNIEIYNNVFGEEYLEYLKNCVAVVIPLKDENISSGQFVFLKAMEYGKPVIITENITIHEYVENEYNGLIINKNKDSLVEAIEKIWNNAQYYSKISDNAKNNYKDKFSFDSFAKSIANIIK